MWFQKNKPILALAPMDGYTDVPFRVFILGIEKRVILFTEFISADFIAHSKDKVFDKKIIDFKKETNLVVQLFGKDPDKFAYSAKFLESKGVKGIDINMGCPAKKVVASQHGAYLMQNIDLAKEIIRKIKDTGIKIPISVKTRLGWDNDKNLIYFVKSLENEGIDLVTIHGRTYNQAFSGLANFEPIYKLKQNINIPVIGNGDIQSLNDFKNKLGNLDGLMIGRGAISNPWLFSEIASSIYDNKKYIDLTLEQKFDSILNFAKLIEKYYGNKRLVIIRKFLAMYIKGIKNASIYRQKLVLVENIKDIEKIFHEILYNIKKDF